jgi:lactoylglutathione lyase
MSDITLNLVVLRSADLARAARFYAALGLRLMKEQHGTGPEHLAAELGEAVFEIYPQGDGESTRGARVGFRVPAVAAAITAALSAGARSSLQPRTAPGA